MLVLGYEHTLRPKYTNSKTYIDGQTPGPIVSPPQLEAIVASRTAEALSHLSHRIPTPERSFAGSAIPLDGIITALQQRLRGILIQTIALELDTCPNPDSLTQQRLLHKFPVLNALLQRAVHDWVSATTIFHSRLHRDKSRLAAWLGVPELQAVESITGTGSDVHPGGHMVLRVLFRGGPCIYYKPRPVTGEWLWNNLLQVIAAQEPALTMPVARVLQGSTTAHYGWAESAWPNDLQTTASPDSRAAGYWHIAGAMLCFAYHVCLSDLHLGNIIATPCGPVVIDAECLGSPASSDFVHPADPSDSQSFEAVLESLLNTGLLPRTSTRESTDVSGLFARETYISTVRVPLWSILPEKKYLLNSVPAVLIDHSNAPERTTFLSVFSQMLEGYRQGADVLLRCRRRLLRPGSSWHTVLTQEHAPRAVVRDTYTYGRLISSSIEPKYLHLMSQRRSMLRAALQMLEPTRVPKALARMELQAVLHLYIPRLVISPDSQTLASSSGRPLIKAFAEQRPAGQVIQRIKELSRESLSSTHLPALLSATICTRQNPEALH